MIKDTVSLSQIQAEWGTVRTTQEMIARNLASAHTSGGMVSHQFMNISHNLCLLFAFSVLEHILLQLKKEGIFASSSDNLGPMMTDSHSSGFRWRDFELVVEGREKRNGIAHRRILIARGECLKYIDAIEEELITWGIVIRQGHQPIVIALLN